MISPGAKVIILKNRGLDPDQWDVTDSGSIVSKQELAQPSTAPEIAPQLKTTIPQAIGYHAAASAVPTAAGLGGGLGTGALLGTIGAGPVGTIIGSLIGAGLSSYGASKIQDALLPDKAKQALALTQQEHSIASTIGDLAPSAIPFSPLKSLASIPETIGALKTAVKSGLPGSLTGLRSALSTREGQLLANSALNVGVGAGQDIANQSSSDQPFNIGQLLTTIGGSALLTRPSGVGVKMGFHDVVPRELAPNPGNVRPSKSPPIESPKVQTEFPVTSTIDPLIQEFQQNKLEFEQRKSDLEKQTEAYRQGIERLGGKVERQLQPVVPERNPTEVQASGALPKNPALDANTETQLQALGLDQDIIDSLNPIKAQELIASGKQIPKAKYSEEPVKQTEQQVFGKDLSDEERQALTQEGITKANRRGMSVEIKPEITGTVTEPLKAPLVGPDIPREVNLAGKYKPGQRAIEVSETKANYATPGHEGLHGFLEDLRNSPDKKDNAFAERVVDIMPGDTLEAKEENLVKNLEPKQAGRDYTDLYGTRRQKFNQWWNDVKNHFAERLGSDKPDVLTGRLMATYKHAAPYGTRLEAFPHLQTKGVVLSGKSTDSEAPKDTSLQVAASESSSKHSDDPQIIASKLRLKYDSRSQSGGVSLNDPNLPPELRAQLPKQWSFEPTSGEYKGHTFYVPEGASIEDVQRRMQEKFGEKHSDKPQIESKTLENFNYKMPSKAWLTPGGSIIEAPTGHNETAKEILKAKGEDVPSSYGMATDRLKKLGYARVIAHGEGLASAENEHQLQPTSGQHKTLKDHAIFGKRSVYFYNDNPKETGGGERFSDEPMIESGKNKDEGVPDKENIRTTEGAKKLFAEPKLAYDTYSDYAANPKTGQAISDKLGEASFKAAREAEKDMKAFNDIRKADHDLDTGQAGKDAMESLSKAKQKTAELEAFTRPDVERHSDEPTIASPRYSIFHAMSAQNDKLRKLDPKLGNAGDRMELDKDLGEATMVHVPTAKVLDLNPTKEELARADKYMNEMRWDGKSSIVPSAKEQKIVDILQPMWKDTAQQRLDAGLKVKDSSGNYRAGSVSEDYFPNMLSDKTLQLLTQGKGTVEAREALDTWARSVEKDSNGKIPFSDARDTLEKYANALGGTRLHSVEFNALRKAEGYRIPDSLRETNLIRNISKYGRRAAMDLSYWKNLQSDPYVAARLGLLKREGGPAKMEGVESLSSQPDVQGALRALTGDFSLKNNPRATSTVRAITNGLLGFGTGVRNTVQLPALMAPYLETSKDVGAMFKALGNLGEAKKASLEYGARSGSLDLDRWHTMDNPDKYTEVVNKLGEALRKYSGRDLMEQSDRIYTFAVGKELAKIKVAQALEGNTKAKAWLDKMGLGLEGKEPALTEDYLNRVAKNFNDKVQGTYDARGLPVGAFDSQYAPYFALSRWSIEKANTIWKDVLTPAYKGENYLPLLTYTLGTVLSGTAIRQLNELMSGKKDYTPSVGEALSEDNKKYLLAAFTNLMQQGSYMGIIGDTAKAASDVFLQHEYPRGPVSFPAADFVTQTVGQNLANWMGAMENGQGGLETTFNLIENLAKSSLQNYRLLDSRIINSDKTDRQNKFRDYRTFKKLEGDDVPAVSALQGNPLDNKDIKTFKQTADVGEAVKLLPGLIEKAITSSKGDPYKLKNELNKIKENSYQTMPGIETAPLEFTRYMSYLAKTQGAEEASKRLSDFMLQGVVNKTKSEMVPSF